MMADPLELFLSKHPDVQEPAQASHLPTMPVASSATDPAAPIDDLERFLAGGEDVNRLQLSLQESEKVAPELAQRVLRLQTKTGLPKEFLERNLDTVERETNAQAFDAEAYRTTSPSAAAWLAEHPNHPAAAREDLTKLNYLERQLRYIGANKEIGELQDELMGIGERAMNDTAGPAERARQAAIEKRLTELEALNAGTDITGFLEQVPGVAVQQWPVNKRVIGGMAEGATKGLVIGAAGGAAMAGPAGAVAGGLTMLGPAALVGGGLEAGKAEMHSALLEYEKLKDENGLPLDRTTIKGLALMAGAANGTLEMMFGLEPLMLKVPGVRGLTRQGLTELLKTPTTREALLRFGRTLGVTMAEEGVTEAMQMYVTKLGGAIAQTLQDGGSIVDRVFTSDTAAQAVQEARAGAQGGGGMALPMASATTAVDLKRAKEAQRMRQAFENIGAVAAETKLRESLPGTLRSIIESATKDGPVETLYLPVDTFSTYFQSKGADPRAVAAALTGSPEEYDQAVASGSDLAVKTADYAELIAGTEHNAFFAQEVRPSLAAMNAREADAWMAEQFNPDVLPGVQTAAVDDPAARVRQEIAGQLEALGFDPAVVDNYAQLYQSRYAARAERRGLGENAFDLFRKVGLTIQRVLPEILQKVGGHTTEMDALLDRLRSGDVPKPGDIYGRSLLEALRETGLQDQGGEVSAIDPDQGRRPFERKLIREDGVTLDRAAERMHEAGYIQERSIAQLLEAMRQEAAGVPIYIPGAENPVLLDVAQKLDDLQHYLREQGVDLTATPNEQIKAMFERLLSAEEAMAVGQDPAAADGETFEQGGTVMGVPAAAHRWLMGHLYDKMGRIPTEKERLALREYIPGSPVMLYRSSRPEDLSLPRISDVPLSWTRSKKYAGFLVEVSAETFGGESSELIKQQVDPSNILVDTTLLPEAYQKKYLPDQAEVIVWNGADRPQGALAFASLKAEADRVIALYGEDELISVETANRLAREGNPDAGMAALVAYVTDDFASITNAPTSPAALALAEWVSRQPKDKTGTLYRVMAFPTTKERQAFVDKFMTLETLKTDRPVMSFTIDDPDGGTPLTHVGLDVASQFGKYNVELHVEAGRNGQRIGVDVSELYGGENNGIDILVPGDTPLRTLDINKRDGTIVILVKTRSSTGKATYFQDPPDPPSVVLTGYELGDFGSDIKSWRKAGRDYYKKQLQHGAPAVHPVLGEVRFTGAGDGKLAKSGAARLKWQMVPELRSIIERGQMVSSQRATDRRDGIVAFHWLETRVKVGAQIYRVGVHVAEDARGDKFYNLNEDLDVWERKYQTPEGTQPFNTGTQGSDEGGQGPTLNQSIAPNLDGINLYTQPEGGQAKGSITFGSGRIDIALLEKADLSTFIHETGHLYLNELVDDATTSGVPQQLRDDLDSVLGWMGLSVRVADGADAIKAAIGRDQHELFARGFEAYALEGQSPSLAMREVFAKFRQWLIQVYRLITYQASAADPGRIGATLQVNLTPEVRKVMNRMVATEAEIQAMEAEASVEPMFTDAASAGMTETEFAAYKEHVSRAGLLAREALQAQVLSQLARERTAWWKEKAAEMQAAVLAEANQRPVYVALSVLQDGVMPDGAPLPEGMVAGKLSRQAVAAVLGRDFVRKLPRGTTTASGGMTPEHAAWIFGYQSAESFLTDLANVRKKKELVEAEAHLRMTREYGDPLIDGTLHEKARAAVLNAEREQVIEAEMVAIDKKRREVTQGALAGLMPPPESVRKLAKAQIARQRVREISPQVHFLAAQRANKAATEALWTRDYLAAGLAKQKEFLNLALYREATAAREEVERIVSHLRELRTKSRQEKIGKAGSDYLEQINAIMERYEFSPVPHITLAKRQALREWIAEKEHEGETLGEEFVVPEEILFEARKMNYKELPFEELAGIRDTIAQIEHFARAKNRLLAEQAIQEKEEVRTLLINQLLEHTPGRPPQALTESSMTRGEKMSRLAERFHASLLKTEQLMDELDGGPEGPWHDFFWNPAVDAQAAEADYTQRITGKIAEAVVNIPASIRNRMLELVTVPGLPRPMSRKEIIGAALNVGNPSNKAKLMKGMGWSDRNLAEMLAHLTKDEWDFVQQVWDTLESMWPDIVVLQKKLTGVAPEKVKTEPVQTQFGTYAGGYYPVMYAAALSAQGALQLSSTFGKLLDDNYVKATLPSGYRKGRIDEFAAPFDLDVDRLPSHIAGVVKDLTHRAWLIDANWIVSDKRIRAALKERLGEALTLRLADWVGQVANDRAGGSSRSLAVWMQMIESFRMNTVIVAMGFKFSTMASQLAGVAPAIEAIGGATGGGGKWFGVGVSEALRRPQSTYDFMTAKSGEMRHRITSRDRDLRDKLRALQGRKDWLAQLQEVSLMGIGYMELMVSMPTWIGAYRKALHEDKTEEQAIRAGDRAVRLSQGAAGAKDLAAVAGRSDTMMRLLTMFYTPFSALYNRLRSIGHDVEGIEDLPRAAVRLWLTVTVAATLGELLAGHGPDKDEPWWRWWLRVQAVYPFLAVPLLRDAISTIASGYGYQFSPISQALEAGTRLTRSAYQAAAGEKDWEELATQAAKVFSYFVGLPTSQLLVTGKYLQELLNGSEHPDDLFEFTKKFLYSRPKE